MGQCCERNETLPSLTRDRTTPDNISSVFSYMPMFQGVGWILNDSGLIDSSVCSFTYPFTDHKEPTPHLTDHKEPTPHHNLGYQAKAVEVELLKQNFQKKGKKFDLARFHFDLAGFFEFMKMTGQNEFNEILIDDCIAPENKTDTFDHWINGFFKEGSDYSPYILLIRLGSWYLDDNQRVGLIAKSDLYLVSNGLVFKHKEKSPPDYRHNEPTNWIQVGTLIPISMISPQINIE